ncbi:hypothetical protein HDV63DRAFT_400865 [Trichoderma sp. SZMC 28014]
MKGRIALFLTTYQLFMPALRRGVHYTENGKIGSMLRLLGAYGRPATATMDGQLGIPQPKPMELLEGFMAHNSTFHSQSAQVFVLTMAGPTRAQQPKVPGGAGSSYGGMAYPFLHPCPASAQYRACCVGDSRYDYAHGSFLRKTRPTIPI